MAPTSPFHLFLRNIKYAPVSPITEVVIEYQVICTGLVIHISPPDQVPPNASIMKGVTTDANAKISSHDKSTH
jgi:hypothetical protein